MDRPDHDIEDFWLSFKCNVISFLDDESIKEIHELSNKLNKLQADKEYDVIEKYICSHITLICYKVIKHKNWYKLGHIFMNIKRWDKLSKVKISDTNTDTYGILSIIDYLVNKKSKSYNDDILDLISTYPDNVNQPLKIWLPIVKMAKERNLVGLIDRIRHIIDTKLITSDIMSSSNHMVMGSNKLITYIDVDKIDELLSNINDTNVNDTPQHQPSQQTPPHN